MPAPQGAAGQHVLVKDMCGEDATVMWQHYIRLMSQVNMYGLGSRVPKSIDASQIDKHSSGQQITLG
eukprot:9133261-Prorocentrum_lima.AAC.1